MSLLDLTVQLDALVPVFSLLLLGALCARMHWLPLGSGASLNLFVYRFALPLLLFVSLANAKLERIWRPDFLIALALGLLITYGLVFLLSRFYQGDSTELSALRAFTATYPNSSFIGIPLLMGLFPESTDVLIAVALATMLANLGVVLTLFTLEWSKMPTGQSLWRIAPKLLRSVGLNPLVLSGILGISVSALGWTLPLLMSRPLEMIGSAAAPVALFAIGMALAVKSHEHVTVPRFDLISLNSAKLLLQPAITWGLLVLLGVEGHWLVLGVLLTSLPTGATVCVVAEAYGVYQAGSTRLFLLSTLLLIISLPLWNTLLSL